MGGSKSDPQECSEAQVKAMLARSPFGTKLKRWVSCGKGVVGAVSPATPESPGISRVHRTRAHHAHAHVMTALHAADPHRTPVTPRADPAQLGLEPDGHHHLVGLLHRVHRLGRGGARLQTGQSVGDSELHVALHRCAFPTPATHGPDTWSRRVGSQPTSASTMRPSLSRQAPRTPGASS